jgi:hypothetical protein
MPTMFRLISLIRGSLPALLALGLAAAHAQSAGIPQRIARFEVSEGSVQFVSGADNQTRLADPRWPLSADDRVMAPPGSRAELQTDSAAIRVADGSDLTLSALDDRTTQLRLTAGTLGAVVRDVRPGERFEIDTPNLALVIDRPGRWRLDVDPGRNTTRVTAEQGSATLYGENGQPLAFAAPQSREFAFRTLAESAPLAMQTGDAFDRWSNDRDRVVAQSQSVRYASAAIPGVTQLDAYGDWNNDPQYGAVWYPRNVAAGWSPYSSGRWEWIPPFGWTWVDDAPWGFAPFHYGRWEQYGGRWGWLPGPARQQRPNFAPSLPFTGARPRIPDAFPPGQVPMLRPMAPQRIGASIEPLHDAVQRDQWERNQRAQQDQHQGDMLRQQQLREAQQRFQPSYGQQQQLQQQQQQQLLQQQQFQQQQQQQMQQQGQRQRIEREQQDQQQRQERMFNQQRQQQGQQQQQQQQLQQQQQIQAQQEQARQQQSQMQMQQQQQQMQQLQQQRQQAEQMQRQQAAQQAQQAPVQRQGGMQPRPEGSGQRGPAPGGRPGQEGRHEAPPNR